MGTYCGKSKDFTFFSNLTFENNNKDSALPESQDFIEMEKRQTREDKGK